MAVSTTIYDVAEAAGVSIATVSNVLNKPDRVAAATREKVLRVADELGYTPKADAATLARKRIGRIGVVAPFTAYPSYLRRLTGVLRAVAGQHVDVSVFDQESAATAPMPVLESIPLRGSFDGLIVMGQPIAESTEERLLAREVPVVVVDADSKRFSVVNVDDEAGGREAARFLLALGHRRFGYLLESQVSEYESQARRRLAGFSAELERGAEAQLHAVQTAGTRQSAHAAARELLSGPGRPTAVMTHFDDLALGVLEAARDLDIRVPEELSVIGYDDGPVAEAVGLSTVRQPFEESGAVAAALLLSSIRSPAHRTATLLDCEVVPRRTTAAVPEHEDAERRPDGPTLPSRTGR